jgi:geranylgeranylglycerol-phosphate geranylgeranyltransferase
MSRPMWIPPKSLYCWLLVVPNSVVALSIRPAAGRLNTITLSQMRSAPMQTYNTNTQPSKFDSMLQLGRVKTNFLPTSVLCFMGGWVANKQFYSVPNFWIAFFVTHLVTTGSMIINDVYDMQIDKINAPHRPLIMGTVTKKEAQWAAGLTFVGASLLSHKFLHHPWIVDASIGMIVSYTPILKKLLLMKNVACASVVSSAIYFIGKSSSTMSVFDPLLYKTCRFIFFSSMLLELILDIRDYQGDLENHIQTIPVVCGRQLSMYFALWLYFVGTLITMHPVTSYTNILYLITTTPVFFELFCMIRDQNRDTKLLTNYTVYTLLMYFGKMVFCR